MSYHYLHEPDLPENTMSSSSELAASLDSMVAGAGVNLVQNDELPNDAVALSSDLYELLTSMEAVIA